MTILTLKRQIYCPSIDSPNYLLENFKHKVLIFNRFQINETV